MICGDKERLYAREKESLVGPVTVDRISRTSGGCLMVASAKDDEWSIQLVQCGPPKGILGSLPRLLTAFTQSCASCRLKAACGPP